MSSLPGPESDGRPRLLGKAAFMSNFGRNVQRIEQQGRNRAEIDGNSIADGLRIALHAGKANLELGLARHRMNVMPLGRFDGRALLVRLEGHDLERHAEDLGHFLAKFAVVADFVARPPQPAADHLLAQ